MCVHLYLKLFLLIFRDIKPGNILLVTTESDPDWKNIEMKKVTVKLADFGQSRFFNKDGSMTMTVAGTPLYMAPELLSGFGNLLSVRYSSSADVYSMGLVILQLYKKVLPGQMTGSPPPQAEASFQFADRSLDDRREFEHNPFGALAKLGLGTPTFLNFLLCQLIYTPEWRSKTQDLLRNPFLSIPWEAWSEKPTSINVKEESKLRLMQLSLEAVGEQEEVRNILLAGNSFWFTTKDGDGMNGYMKQIMYLKQYFIYFILFIFFTLSFQVSTPWT